MFTQNANKIFAQAIDDYHRYDDVDHQLSNPYAEGTIDHLLYMKNWVDTVQWHLEDIIRDPRIDPVEALKIKRRIDKSNQVRTDMVEYIDSYLLDKYKNTDVQPGARINTETPAWAIDRLSILALKIYHMRQEVLRKDVDEAHRAACQQKLDVLLSQQVDLSTAIEELPDKGGTFSTYAYRLIWNEICDALIYANRRNETEITVDYDALAYRAGSKMDSSEPLWDTLCSTDSVLYPELKLTIEEAQKTAAPTVQKGIEALLLMVDGYSCREIGERYGVEPNMVTAWASKARKYLMTRLTSPDGGTL